MGEDCEHNSPPTASSQHSLLTCDTFSLSKPPWPHPPCAQSPVGSQDSHLWEGMPAPYPSQQHHAYYTAGSLTALSIQLSYNPPPPHFQNLPFPAHAQMLSGKAPPLLRAAPYARGNCHEEGGGSFLL